MSYIASRLTLYALLSAFETDLRQIIKTEIGCQVKPEDLLGSEVLKNAVDKLQKSEGQLPKSSDVPLQSLLYYIDFGDLYQIINRWSKLLSPNFAQFIKKGTVHLQNIVKVRNRVAHSRPLEVNDFPTVYDFSVDSIKQFPEKFTELNNTLQKLEQDPSFVLGLQIPYLEHEKTESHNLPIPDFDETGFIGRSDFINPLIKNILGPFPVFTIVGEGGLGKTALALRVAYNILDLPSHPFDAVIWSTAKTMKLTTTQIVNIDGAIHSSLGLIDSVSYALSGQKSSNPIDDVLSYLKEFKILLILDNLETVIDDNINRLIKNLPEGSKILITSRIGLGAYDFPVKLTPMDEIDSIKLLRLLAQMRGVNGLSKLNNQKLGEYCNKMHNNPGFIKWFVSTVQAGQRPEDILSNPSLFHEYCMSNIYGYLSENSKTILRSTQVIPGPRSQAELAFLNGSLDVSNLQQSLQELISANMVHMTSTVQGTSFESRYEVSDLAKAYLNDKHPIPASLHKELSKKWRQLISAGEEMRAEQVSNPFSYYSISRRSSSDFIVEKYLLDVLRFIKRDKYSEADNKLLEAKRLAPEYYEVYRVEAYLRIRQENFPAARNSYEAALELEPNSAPLHYLYSGFLARQLDDQESAMFHIEQAEVINPTAYQIKMEKARLLLFQKRFDEAKKIIDKLLSRTDIDIWSIRKLHDLFLNYYQRLADYCLSQHNEFGAFDALENLMHHFLSIPKNFRDNDMIYRLKKAMPTAHSCLYYIHDAEKVESLNAMIDWFEEETRGNVRVS